MAKLLLAAAAVVIVISGLAHGEATEGSRTLAGGFTWTNGGEGDLEAVFTPAGENRWEVAFHFTFGGRAHTYSGTAQGNLADGPLSGRVQTEDGGRTFTFDGSFEEGTFRGTHAEIDDGKPQPTGTLTLAG